MKTINPDLISPCGLYCGVCAVYIAHRDNNQKFKERLVGLYKGALPDCEHLTVEDMKCRGCCSDERFVHCRNCDIRACVKKKNYTGCHRCNEFPCRYIDNIPMAVGKKVIMRAVPYRRAVGTEQWAHDEKARYVCPQCDNEVFRGAVKCNRCKTLLDLD